MSALPLTQDDRIIWDTWLARYHFPAMTAADEVGTFAALSSRSLSTEELAAQLRVDARALGIHLGLLAALGFVERRDGRWRATAAARIWLHPEGEGYYGPVIHRYRAVEALHEEFVATLRTGNKAQTQPSAAEEWERGEMPAEMARNITAFMNAVIARAISGGISPRSHSSAADGCVPDLSPVRSVSTSSLCRISCIR